MNNTEKEMLTVENVQHESKVSEKELEKQFSEMRFDRRSLRRFFNHTEYGKRLKELPFLHPDNIETRKSNREGGKQKHFKFVGDIQDRMYNGRLSKIESELIEKLKALNVSQDEIDNYLDIWSDTVIWPKSDTCLQSKKELKKLNKKYNLYG